MIKMNVSVLLKVIAVLIFIPHLTTAQSGSTEKPNIVYILADDLGIGDVSGYNPQSKIKTPAIDRLISTGVAFNNAHTSSAVCSPTRYSILTGRYNWRSSMKKGVLNGYSKEIIEPGRETIASLLKQKGYNTACIGKWHLGWSWNNIRNGIKNIDYSKPIENGPNSNGFDYSYCISASLDMPPYVYLENGKCTVIPDDTCKLHEGMGWYRGGLIAKGFKHEQVLDDLTAKTLTYINEHAADNKPFFIYLPLTAPHTPILPSGKFRGKTGLNDYGDFVLMVDDVVNKVVNELKKKGVYDNTLVVFTSDNGCSPSADYETLLKKGHNPSWKYRGTKSDIYDGGHRVPFIISWPTVTKKSSVSNQLLCSTDFMATVAELLHIPLPDNTAEDSYSFLKDITGKRSPQPARIDIVNHSLFGVFAISKGPWKLIMSSNSGGWSDPKPTSAEAKTLPPIQLYNMVSDIDERNNVYDKYPAVVNELTALLTRYIKEGRSTSGKPQKNTDPQYWPELSWMAR